jgi:hypothetical protein
LHVTVSGASADAIIGLIRAGVALQMERPMFGGITPLGMARLADMRQGVSETGQWLGATVQKQALAADLSWQHLTAAWVRANLVPFLDTLPQTPFLVIQNPLRMPESVAWCWTQSVPATQNMGLRDLMSLQMSVTGYLG